MKFIIVFFMSLLIVGCIASNPITEQEVDTISKKYNLTGDSKEIQKCHLYYRLQDRQGYCAITTSEFLFFLGKNTKNIDSAAYRKFEISDIKKVGLKGKMRLLQVQIQTKTDFIVFSVTPNYPFVDRSLTRSWYQRLIDSGVSTYKPTMYYETPPTQYKIKVN
ncbi:hypothetical protein [Agarilytica rhodophyticola]|uniref:hypothetical protein n=1 Tax=Agarilytica rhodophyticola TaxID=1737490 RepID=UPI000B346F4A|nr:hypothetical protein [Agarilytica rhodophyticola]